jgi:malate synthase
VKQNRVKYSRVDGAEELFTPEFCAYLAHMQEEFGPRVQDIRARRAEVWRTAAEKGMFPIPAPDKKVVSGDWRIAPYPDELNKPGIEISGPASITGMFINALNPGPEGDRAEGDLDDDEDSAGYQLSDTVRASLNRLAAVEHRLTYNDPEKRKEYKLAPGEIPFFMHRERPLSVDEPEVTVDGKPVSASILGTCLTLFHAGKAHVARKQGIYFYLPKLESPQEAALYRDLFNDSRKQVPHLKEATIKAVILIESLPAVYYMEEMLYALGPYAAGLNAARWDLQASILEYIMTDPKSVWPDRFDVDIKTTEFLGNMFRRMVAICLKRGGIAIGGMATALPSKDDAVNKMAAASIRADKDWEARQGFLRAWVAHIFHMKAAASPFKELRASGWKPSAAMRNPDNYPVEMMVPEGHLTIEGTRRNARMLVEYLEGWLNGRGAKGIDSLAGKPGMHPALMEDLATARISVAQIAQRVRHNAKDGKTGQVHDLALVKSLLQEECEDILAILKKESGSSAACTAAEARYRKTIRIAMRWIKNYLDLDFRSLGSYTRDQLEEIAQAADAF